MITLRPVLLGAATTAALVPSRAFAQTASDFMGEWHGVLDLGSQQLRLKLVVADGPRATLFSVDQGNSEIPVGTTRIDGAEIALDIPVISGRYAGRFTSGRIQGRFTQGGTLPLVLQRGAMAAAVPDALTQARLAALRANRVRPDLRRRR